MLLNNLSDMIKGKYAIIINNNIVEQGDNLKVNGITAWLYVTKLEAKDNITYIYC